jgi:hypothetical protein
LHPALNTAANHLSAIKFRAASFFEAACRQQLLTLLPFQQVEILPCDGTRGIGEMKFPPRQ